MHAATTTQTYRWLLNTVHGMDFQLTITACVKYYTGMINNTVSKVLGY